MEGTKVKDREITPIKYGINHLKLNLIPTNKSIITNLHKANNLTLNHHNLSTHHTNHKAHLIPNPINNHIPNINQATQNAHQASTSSGLPSQPQPNSKGSINAITLRSGIKLDEVGLEPTSLSKEPHDEEIEEEVEVMRDEEENIARGEEEPSKVKEPKRKNPLEEPTPIPFPTLAKKAKKHEGLDPNVVEIFKNVKVTVLLFQAIQQVPKYAKFLKDVCTHKDKIGELNKSPDSKPKR
ncbi:hypothetical protein AHAS_Ahas19G0292900 [Arachis hypogaea]